MAKIPAQVAQYRIARARSVVKKGILYHMGHGGLHPEDSKPSRDAYCDCTGFAAWVLGMSRNLVATGKAHRYGMDWIETTLVYWNAHAKQPKAERLFVELAEPEPGCFVVYPDQDGDEGHIGLVVSVQGAKLWGIDCSSGQSRRVGQAITERDLTFFKKRNAIFVTLAQDVQ